MPIKMDAQFPFHIVWNDDTETKLLSFRDHLVKMVRCTHEGHIDALMQPSLGTIVYACRDCWTTPIYEKEER